MISRENHPKIIASILLDSEGNLVVKYVYGAWGNCTTIVLDENAADIANLNSFRYRSYYLDTGLNLYYLKTRYYDPEMCRFITIDDISYLAPDTINGLNLYAYCTNNPVNKYDPTGKFPWLLFAAAMLFTPIGGMITQTAITATSYVGIKIASLFDDTIRKDMEIIENNIFNQNGELVLACQKVSFYKGVPVFRTAAGGRSWSFGAIFLTKDSNKDDLSHERGHNSQLMMMGVANYGVAIGVPSKFMLGPWAALGGDNYYRAPWEITADMLGGVSRKVHTQRDITSGWFYLNFAIGFFPACYLFI